MSAVGQVLGEGDIDVAIIREGVKVCRGEECPFGKHVSGSISDANT